jgi:hypothetical protein
MAPKNVVDQAFFFLPILMWPLTQIVAQKSLTRNKVFYYSIVATFN